MSRLDKLKIRIFADGADLAHMLRLAANPRISGFTTNPTLMRKAGISDYAAFAREVLSRITDRPISFEVFADEFEEMEHQAELIASWGSNVWVKIPITNTKGEPAVPTIRRLAGRGIKLNVTAILTLEQVAAVAEALDAETPAIVSVFAGRIADTGRDPVPMMRECRRLLGSRPNAELLWASARELLNLFHAEESGSDIITLTSDLLDKLALVGKDLGEYSLDTVRMFHRDAAAAGFSLPTGARARSA